MRLTPLLLLSLAGSAGACALPSGASDNSDDHDALEAAATSASSARLLVDGQRLVDPTTKQTVVLRGVNLAGSAKLPPFLPFATQTDGTFDVAAIERHFDLLASAGANSIRLTIFWEAYEPERGHYDETYLARMTEIAAIASRKNLYVVVDIHQDLFSRHAGKGCGSGFPRWTVPERFRAEAPKNPGVGCGQAWANEVIDGAVGGAFGAFYANEGGVRDAYLAMLERVMSEMKRVPRVLGIDPLNEPIYNLLSDLGGESGSELGSLYRDATSRVRQVFPSATMFLEGHIWTNNGSVVFSMGPGLPSFGAPVTLPKPSYGNVVYAPHFYHIGTMVSHRFKLSDRAFVFSTEFDNIAAVQRDWNAPVWIGEFGIFADTENAPDYFDTFYARMNRAHMSGAVWNSSPHWGEDGRLDDGWNDEDLSIVDGRSDTLRPFYRASAYAERIAGTPVRQDDVQPNAGGPRELRLDADAGEELGETVIYLPRTPTSVSGSNATCAGGATIAGGPALVCRVDAPGRYTVTVRY